MPGTRISFATPAAPAEDASPLAADLKLHTTWHLYADEALLVGGPADAAALATAAAASYNPTLMATISDVDGLWRLLRAAPAPSSRAPSFTMMLFRRAVNPTWEDPRNKTGGTLNLVLWDRDRHGFQDKQVVDDGWVLTVLALVGESLGKDLAHHLTGVMVKVRKTATTLQVWTSTAVKSVLQQIVDALRAIWRPAVAKPAERIEFFCHAASGGGGPAASKTPGKGGLVGRTTSLKAADLLF